MAKMIGATEDSIQLCIFPFSLRDKARGQFQALQSGSITTWAKIGQIFLFKFFALVNTTQLRTEIGTFKQQYFESLYEAQERFKDLLLRCPQHGYQDWLQILLFYYGLNGHNQKILDVAARGTLMAKFTLLEDMASNNYQWPSDWSIVKKAVGVFEVAN